MTFLTISESECDQRKRRPFAHGSDQVCHSRFEPILHKADKTEHRIEGCSRSGLARSSERDRRLVQTWSLSYSVEWCEF